MLSKSAKSWLIFIPFAGVLQKRCSYKFRNIRKKTPALETFFNKDAGLRPETLLKKTLQQRCFPVKIGKILETALLKNVCERLPLKI